MKTTSAAVGSTATAVATCPAGKKVLGGSARASVTVVAQRGRAAVRESYPSAATR